MTEIYCDNCNCKKVVRIERRDIYINCRLIKKGGEIIKKDVEGWMFGEGEDRMLTFCPKCKDAAKHRIRDTYLS